MINQKVLESTLAINDIMGDLYSILPMYIIPSMSTSACPSITIQPACNWNHVVTIKFDIKEAEYVLHVGDRYIETEKSEEIRVSIANPKFKCEIMEIVIDFVEEIVEYWSEHLKEARKTIDNIH